MATDYSKYKKTLGGMTKSSSLLSASVIDVLSNACYVVSALDKAPSNGNNVGDVTIVSSLIVDGNDALSSRTAYYWNGSAWAAMNGNYNAKNVYFDKNISCAGNYTSFGTISKTTDQIVVLSSEGKSLDEVMRKILTKPVSGTTVKPSVSIGKTKAIVQYGTLLSPSYSFTFNHGSYTYGPTPTGVSATSYWTIRTNSNVLTTNISSDAISNGVNGAPACNPSSLSATFTGNKLTSDLY